MEEDEGLPCWVCVRSGAVSLSHQVHCEEPDLIHSWCNLLLIVREGRKQPCQNDSTVTKNPKRSGATRSRHLQEELQKVGFQFDSQVWEHQRKYSGLCLLPLSPSLPPSLSINATGLPYQRGQRVPRLSGRNNPECSKHGGHFLKETVGIPGSIQLGGEKEKSNGALFPQPLRAFCSG